MDYFKGWHKPTVCTTVLAVFVIIIFYHLFFHVRKREQ